MASDPAVSLGLESLTSFAVPSIHCPVPVVRFSLQASGIVHFHCTCVDLILLSYATSHELEKKCRAPSVFCVVICLLNFSLDLNFPFRSSLDSGDPPASPFVFPNLLFTSYFWILNIAQVDVLLLPALPSSLKSFFLLILKESFTKYLCCGWMLSSFRG